MNLLEKFRNYMLGVEEEEIEVDEVPEKIHSDESKSKARETERLSRAHDFDKTDYSATTFKSRKSSESNVLSLSSVPAFSEAKGKIVITYPLNVSEAPNISDYLKQNTICAVNLEGVDRADAQRIADFLGGVAYALNCSIERISNDIFIIAPSQIGISNELKDEVKSTKGSTSWIAAFK